MDQKNNKIDCPVCNGTALVKVPYKLAMEDVYTDTDGFKRMRQN